MRSIAEERRIFKKYFPKDWQRRKVKTIKRREILDTVETLADSAPQMANQFLKALHRFFVFCVNREYLEFNPCSRVASPAPTVSKDRWLSEDEIREFWEKVESAGISTEVRRALKLILVTAQRPGEVAGLHTDEIDGRWWTIPGERTKNKMPHRVYLTDLALEILGKGSGYIFPSPAPRRSRSPHIRRSSLSHALSLNEYLGLPRWTPHDLRRTAASHMTSMGVSRLDVGKILNHSDKSITAIYDRNSYDREKTKAMESWARKLAGILSGKKAGNVVEFRKG
jgi:integrase